MCWGKGVHTINTLQPRNLRSIHLVHSIVNLYTSTYTSRSSNDNTKNASHFFPSSKGPIPIYCRIFPLAGNCHLPHCLGYVGQGGWVHRTYAGWLVVPIQKSNEQKKLPSHPMWHHSTGCMYGVRRLIFSGTELLLDTIILFHFLCLSMIFLSMDVDDG